jgi:hypothetical protein
MYWYVTKYCRTSILHNTLKHTRSMNQGLLIDLHVPLHAAGVTVVILEFRQ